MVSVITGLLLVSAYVVAQDSNCNYRQNVQVYKVHYINNNYSARAECRYMMTAPDGYNCRLDCNLDMPYSTGCSADRLLISRSGDTRLKDAEPYCGRRSLTVVSTEKSMVVGLTATSSSVGGSFMCNLTAQRAPVSCSCGVKNQTRIVGGQETKPNEYTMMAAIIDSSIPSLNCSGVIISKRHILSAAHCLLPFIHNPYNLGAVVGEYPARAFYLTEELIIHENYNATTFDYDIGLIKLRSDIRFSKTVQPVCLPFKYVNNDFADQLVTLAGWGTTSFGGPRSDVLRKVEVPVLRQSTCRALAGDAITDRQMCTNETRKDACQLDSGGPVLYTDPGSGLVFIVGVISHGTTCATGHPGVNTRLAPLLGWIISHANDNDSCFKR